MRSLFLTVTFSALGLFIYAGCSSEKDDFKAYQAGEKTDHEHDHAHEHGPHDGHIIELGEHEYHAELVFDKESRKITIYILDKEAKAGHPIPQEKVTLNLTIDGQPQSFDLAAAKEASDPEGQSSKFELADNATIKEKIDDEEKIVGRLNVTIGDKAYVGEISHDHEHGEHGHAH